MLSGLEVLFRVGVHDAVTLVTPAGLALHLALPLIGQLKRKTKLSKEERVNWRDYNDSRFEGTPDKKIHRQVGMDIE